MLRPTSSMNLVASKQYEVKCTYPQITVSYFMEKNLAKIDAFCEPFFSASPHFSRKKSDEL